MPDFRFDKPVLDEDAVAAMIAKYPMKFAWFLQHGYKPHYYQALYHSLTNPETDRLCRFRHLVAGRRGGKTLSAAWDTIFYCLNPEEFHHDVHGVDSDRPLYVWVLAKDHPTGKAANDAIREVLKQAGLTHGKEYKENRGNRWIEFENGSFLHFRSAEDPESLRGAGLDILWIDEAAFIPDERAYANSRPALSDKQGIVSTTTTPDGKNWLYDEFWIKAASQPTHARVEYRSIDNPYFPKEEWEETRNTYHPLLFEREFMASFEAMAGRELAGHWLHYYTMRELPRDLLYYIGVDPAISLADTADRFVISCIGVTEDRSQAYLIEQYADKIPFAEQVEVIQEWYLRFRPQMVGVETNAYQAALAQQVMRLPGFLPISHMKAIGKKWERILAMAPLFKVGRIKIRKDQYDFITEWIDYDSTKKNPKDDCLDSVEIALRTAGALLPLINQDASPEYQAADFDELARQMRPTSFNPDEAAGYDDHMGGDW